MTDEPHRTAVIDVGSNSFRLVVFSANGWWKRVDEIHEAVRIGAGLDASGELQPEAMERALRTLDLYAHFCRATGLQDVRPVATSAIRDAANREAFLARARTQTGLEVRVLSVEEEARYGYLAAVNSTTLSDGVVLDLGGGSMQLVRVVDRRADELRSWPLGAVRMTEHFLAEEEASRKQLKALRAHVAAELEDADWLGGRMAGIGGTVRNLAAAAQHAAGLPSLGVQGFVLTREALDALVEELAERPSSERAKVPGIKPARADLILAGAAVIQAVMEAGAIEGIEVTEAGLREGVFFESLLGDPHLFEDVRAESVRNLSAQFHFEPEHVAHVAELALQMWDALAAAGLHDGDPAERELLWAAAMLHDVGAAVDYDDHHKHSQYLILNGGLPGFEPRETALIALIARYHRKGDPTWGDLEALAGPGDQERLARGAALLRLAEQLERSRDQIVRGTRLHAENGAVRLELVGDGDVRLAQWAADRERGLFEQAFERQLEIVA
jgi:exopolyphosphatase / guanosine-5'-triphosphate,3'-diphosphate pyrophosphatase